MAIKVRCMNCLHWRFLRIRHDVNSGSIQIDNPECPKCGSRMVKILKPGEK